MAKTSKLTRETTVKMWESQMHLIEKYRVMITDRVRASNPTLDVSPIETSSARFVIGDALIQLLVQGGYDPSPTAAPGTKV